ncbi:MAG: hypothetical protein IKV86_00770 [Clostridia bacterium]|nr:hypothetical protein [Clostridia bacterium]
MKLKRIISALLVFTMVMACSVCAVSANGTYQVTTSYDVSTKEITVNAKLAGATADSMVSYLIIEPEEVTTGEGEEAETTLNYDVKADGSNILHIDQATANASGAATYDSATIPFADLENAKVKFVSSASEELAPYEVKRNADGSVSNVGTYTKSVTKFTKLQTGVIVYNQSDSGETVGMYYVTKDGAVIGTDSRGTNLNAARWQSEGHFDDLFNGDTAFINKGLKQYIPLDDVVAWSLVLANTDNRESAVDFLFKKVGTSFSGELSTDTGTIKIYNNYNEATGKGSNYDLTINGIYKDDVTDGKFGTLNVSGGDVFSVDKSNVPYGYSKPNGITKAVKAMTIDAKPIYGTFTSYNNGIEYPSVTILVTATDVATADNAGLKIQAVTKGAATKEGAYPAEVEVVDLGICPNAYTGTKNFAIQLFDSANEGYLNPELYDIVATPVVKVADEWVELTVTGSATGADAVEGSMDGKYFVIKRDTVATEAAAE